MLCVKVSDLLKCSCQNQHCRSNTDHSCYALYNTGCFTADFVEYRHRSHKVCKQNRDSPESDIQLIAVYHAEHHQRGGENADSRSNLHQRTGLQLRLISFKAATNTIKNTDKRLFEAPDIINGFSESVDELGDTKSDSTQGYTVQQVDNAAEIGFSEVLGNCSAKFAKCLDNTTGDFGHSVPNSFEKLQELAVGKSITNSSDSNDNHGFHFASSITDL